MDAAAERRGDRDVACGSPPAAASGSSPAPTRSGRRSSTTSASTRRCACGCAATRRDCSGSIPAVALVGARAATSYGDHVALELAADLAGSRHPRRLGRCLRHRRRGAPRGDRGRRAHGRTARGRRGPRLPRRSHAAARPHRRDGRGRRSEVPCGSAPTKWRFLQRNRLIAALARRRSSSRRGGAAARSTRRGTRRRSGVRLGAVPGPITSAASAGTHRLLREFGARVHHERRGRPRDARDRNRRRHRSRAVDGWGSTRTPTMDG